VTVTIFDHRRIIIQAEQDGCAQTCRLSRLNVGDFVADQDACAQVQIEVLTPAQEHTRIRLPIRRIGFVLAYAMLGMIGAIINVSNVDLLLAKFLYHPTGQFQKLCFRVIAPSDARLISRYQQEVAAIPRRTAQIENPILKVKFFLTMDIFVIDVYDAVPVKKERLGFIQQKFNVGQPINRDWVKNRYARLWCRFFHG
jgi:hypothetical protein